MTIFLIIVGVIAVVALISYMIKNKNSYEKVERLVNSVISVGLTDSHFLDKIDNLSVKELMLLHDMLKEQSDRHPFNTDLDTCMYFTSKRITFLMEHPEFK